MATRISLASEESARALEVLQRELLALRPSPGQFQFYRAMNVSLLAFVTLTFAALALALLGFSTAALVAAVLTFLAFVVLSVVFLLNLPLISKLWRIARMRRRLGLEEALAVAFWAQRQKSRSQNLLSLVVAALGALFLLLGVALLAVASVVTVTLFDAGTQPPDRGELQIRLAVALLGAVVYLALGLPLFSLHLMRRGMERLAVIDRLHAQLSTGLSGTGKDADRTVSISSNDYELIARIERAHIVAERQENIQHGGHAAEAPGYAVHMGAAAHHAKSGLAPAERLLVDERILQLMDDPEPSGVVVDPRDALHRTAVPNTAVEIDYYVDREGRRIKIAGIVSPSASPTAEPAAGG